MWGKGLSLRRKGKGALQTLGLTLRNLRSGMLGVRDFGVDVGLSGLR